MEKQFVCYYRVSTQRQGQSGLGLDAQREVVRQYLSEGHRSALVEFVEVETGKGLTPFKNVLRCVTRSIFVAVRGRRS